MLGLLYLLLFTTSVLSAVIGLVEGDNGNIGRDDQSVRGGLGGWFDGWRRW